MTEGGLDPHSRRSYLKKKERKQKEARIIVRNLPFKITEEKFREHFEQYGEVVDTNLLRKGQKLVGCGFVQFGKKISAAKAIANTSGKPLLGRVVIADWAIPKKKFVVPKPKVKQEIKQEVLSDSEIKEEPSDDEVKSEPESSDCEDEKRLSKKKRKRQVSESEDESESSDDESDGEEDDDDDEEEDSDEDEGEEKRKSKKRRVYDVLEGRTVFIKNVPFSATEEDLESAVKKFGPIYYAKICLDPITEHPKGTAFVKFHSKESADSCLAAGTEFQLDGTVLDPHPALARNVIRKQEQTKVKKQKDSRNLYLLKEGVVRAGSEAAEGVSEGDMSKRLQLERWKREVIKDLGRFVSPVRLVVQNLPPTLTDARLRALAKKNAPPNAKLTEARVMRDLKSRDARGLARSKEYGFLCFTKHEDALACLRGLNNNPSVFRAHRRPIVSFSVENINALRIKQMRLEASRKPKEEQEKVKTEGVKVEGVKVEGKKNMGKKEMTKKVEVVEDEETEGEKFVGARATPGTKKYQNSLNIRKEAVAHRAALKKVKAKNKARKQARIRTKAKEKKTGPNKAKDNDTNFSRLVDKYKKQISKAASKSKWYE